MNVNVWRFTIYPKPLERIREYGKTVEGRAPDPSDEKNISEIQPGDIIRFELKKNGMKEEIDLQFEVEYVEKYPDTRAMLESEGVGNVLPGIDSIEEGVQRYHSFPGYEERIKEYGIYAIGIQENYDG